MQVRHIHMWRHQNYKNIWTYCPEHADVHGNQSEDSLASKVLINGKLTMGRPDLLQTI